MKKMRIGFSVMKICAVFWIFGVCLGEPHGVEKLDGDKLEDFRAASKQREASKSVEGVSSDTQIDDMNQDKLEEDNPNANLESCVIVQSCQLCPYEQILNFEKCQKTGFIEILNCDKMEGIVRSCEKEVWIPNLYTLCGLSWVILIFGIKRLQMLKEKEEKRIVSKIVSG